MDFRIILVASTLVLLTFSGLAQEKKAGRYESFKLKAGTETVDELLARARKLKETDRAGALNNIEEALGISLTAGNALDEGKCYLLLGEINVSIEEWKLALDNFNTAYEKLKPRFAVTAEFRMALRGRAETNLKLGNFQDAMRSYEEVLQLKLTTAERAETELGISEVFYQLGDFSMALSTVEGIQLSAPSNTPLMVSIQNQKAKIFARLNEVERARNSLSSSQNAISSNRATIPQKQEEGLKEAKEEVADVLHEQARYDEEIDLRNQSIAYNLESNNLPEVSKDKIGIGQALAAKGETSAAIRELEEAALIADTIGNPKNQASAFLSLAGLYEKNGRNAQALQAYKRYSDAIKKSEQLNQTRMTEKAELIDKQRDIEMLTKDVAIGQREDTIARSTVARQQLIIYGLLLIIVIIAVTSYFIYKNALASKTANQLLALKSLRSQMNPHFIFNALNSVNQFIAQNDERTANKFLAEFSRLMRLVLENSQEDFIPLDKEQEIISLYLKLEHYRFRDKFDYEINIDDSLNPEMVEIPPMLLQPYIENAVWHGLRYKESKGRLILNMKRNHHGLEVEIIDDGIGRKRSAALKTPNQKMQNSTALRNIQERLAILNRVYKSHYSVDVADLDEQSATGTKVTVRIPEHKPRKPKIEKASIRS